MLNEDAAPASNTTSQSAFILRVFAGAIALVLTLSTGIAIGKAKGEVKLLEPAGTGENSIFGQTIDPEALDKGANDSQNLYVIQAEAGWAERGPEGHWEITIENAPKTLWFNDRPARDSGEMDTAVFVHQWNKIFATSPPNGAIVAPDGPDGEHPTAFEFTNPRFDTGGHDLTFTAVLDHGQKANADTWLEALTRENAPKHGRVVLFIDDAGGVACHPDEKLCTSWPFNGTTIDGYDVQGWDLYGSQFVNTTIKNSNFSGSAILSANFFGAQISDSHFDGMNPGFSNPAWSVVTVFNNSNLQNTTVSGNWQGVNFTGSTIGGSSTLSGNFQHSQFGLTNMSGITIRDADFSGANLDRADLSNATLINVNFSDAQLVNTKFTNAKFQNVSFKRANTTGTYFEHTDLSNQDFSYQQLDSAVLDFANLTGANLTAAQLDNASVNNANMTKAVLDSTNFNYASVKGVDFTEAELKGTQFFYTDLSGSNFAGAYMWGADMHKATLIGATLGIYGLPTTALGSHFAGLVDWMPTVLDMAAYTCWTVMEDTTDPLDDSASNSDDCSLVLSAITDLITGVLESVVGAPELAAARIAGDVLDVLGEVTAKAIAKQLTKQATKGAAEYLYHQVHYLLTQTPGDPPAGS